MRDTFTSRDVKAGCFVCGGLDAMWFGGNAQGVAARHHDHTKHPTWCDVAMTVRYGREGGDDRQHDIEDAIASASSGDAPVCAPLPEFDAPPIPMGDVSAPVGRPSRPALAAAHSPRRRTTTANGQQPEAADA